MSRNKLLFLDSLRGFAAVYVVLAHAITILWAGAAVGGVAHPVVFSTLPEKILSFLMVFLSFAHQAVLFFFVLSGFVIHLRYAKQLKAEGQKAAFDWLPFMIRRFRRIYPPLLLVLVVTIVLDQIGMSQHYPIYFMQSPYTYLNQHIYDHSLSAFVQTLIQFPVIFGTLLPIWSLKLEWWFYVFYPLFWLFAKRSLLLTTLLVFVLFGLTFIPSLWVIPYLRDIFSGFVLWWLGALLAEIYQGRLSHISISYAILAIPAAILIRLLLLPLTNMDLTLQDFTWSLLFTGVIALLITYQNRGGSLSWLVWFRPLGDFSYTLYIVHYPLLMLASGWLASQSKDGTLPTQIWPFIAIVPCVIFIAYLLHLIGEKPFLHLKTEVRPEVSSVT